MEMIPAAGTNHHTAPRLRGGSDSLLGVLATAERPELRQNVSICLL